MQKKPYNLLDDNLRLAALKALRSGDRSSGLKGVRLPTPAGGTGKAPIRKGVQLSDEAARLIAKAISSMIGS